MRAVVAAGLTALAGCGGNPLERAWHGAIEVETAERGEGSCDPALADDAPDAPFLFLAAEDGPPDAASLYWCTAPETCEGVPWANVWIDRWTETRLEGSFALSEALGTSCTAQWNAIDAIRTEDGEVELEVRSFAGQVVVPTQQDCDRFTESVLETECDTVRRFTGRQTR